MKTCKWMWSSNTGGSILVVAIETGLTVFINILFVQFYLACWMGYIYAKPITKSRSWHEHYNHYSFIFISRSKIVSHLSIPDFIWYAFIIISLQFKFFPKVTLKKTGLKRKAESQASRPNKRPLLEQNVDHSSHGSLIGTRRRSARLQGNVWTEANLVAVAR